jgi:dipeptidyl-peptidase-4
MKHARFPLLLCLLALSCAQVAGADIEFALGLAKRTENKVYRSNIRAQWLPDGRSFWYRVQTGPQSHEFVLINAQAGTRRSGSDLRSLGIASEESKTSAMKVTLRSTRRTGEASGIKFVNNLKTPVDLFWIDQQGEHVRYGSVRADDFRDMRTYDGHVWLITTSTGEPLAVVEAKATDQTIVIDGKGAKSETEHRSPPNREVKSPDGRWAAYIEKDIVMLRDIKGGGATALKTPLDGKSPYRGGITWSPDSKNFVVSNCQPTPIRRVGVIESTPKDQIQPRLREFDYTKPGDPLPKPSPVIFRLTEGGYEWTIVKPDLFPTPFTQSMQIPVEWSADSREFCFNYNQRGHQLYRILAVDVKTGAVRTVIEETSKTFIDYTKKTWRHWLKQTDEMLWTSERDGWCHLYLYDVKTGAVKNQVTRGAWPVHEVFRVDEDRREVWFTASGLKVGEDPYHEHLCRVKFDGTGFTQLTEADGQHDIEFSPTREFFIATWSRADHPSVAELRRSNDGKLVCTLEKAEAGDLLASGWTMPERFMAKGRDEKTDIHGVIIKPSTFDPNKRYPVVEDIYAGPHSAFAPKEFGRLLRHHQIAELGFIVVQMDGMGTNHRGKAFHDVCWKNLADAGFPDRIAWIKAAAVTRPWMDLSRVGIYGGSAGGQNAMRALIDHHDFYKVAVSDCGCHDNRMDKIWWNEQWMGWPLGPEYAASSNVDNAHKLQGKLLLVVGELDTNVDPASTMQVVNALIRANKQFDLLVVPNGGHTNGGAYGVRKMSDFFVHNLMGVETPDRNITAPAPAVAPNGSRGGLK